MPRPKRDEVGVPAGFATLTAEHKEGEPSDPFSLMTFTPSHHRSTPDASAMPRIRHHLAVLALLLSAPMRLCYGQCRPGIDQLSGTRIKAVVGALVQPEA